MCVPSVWPALEAWLIWPGQNCSLSTRTTEPCPSRYSRGWQVRARRAVPPPGAQLGLLLLLCSHLLDVPGGG